MEPESRSYISPNPEICDFLPHTSKYSLLEFGELYWILFARSVLTNMDRA